MRLIFYTPDSLDHSGYFYLLINIFQVSTGIISPDFSVSVSFITGCVVLLFLLFSSGFVSGAETAFFSITPAQLNELKESKKSSGKLIYQLLTSQKRLLATLLITINFVNIAIVVLSSVLINSVFNFTSHEILGFIIQVVVVTFILVLFCEVMPKVYAQQNAVRIAHRSVFPIYFLDKMLRPFSYLLVSSTSFVEKRFQQKGYDVSVDQLTHAIDITSTKDTPEEEKNILKGIARFGNIDVKQIMKSRMDVSSVAHETKLKGLLSFILENQYSRLPVYKETFDNIAGILYIKDLLPYLDKQDDESFNWQSLIRPAYFVPETKKINDLLREFQEKKMHVAIVVDEYGGNSGLVTLEDILEEIVGEINDEFDEEEVMYSKLDDLNYVFEGKSLLNDICRIIETDRKTLEVTNDDIDTLAGLLLDIKGGIPQKGEVIEHAAFKFKIESSDRRRIKRVKITLPEKKAESSSGNLTFLFLLLASSMLLTSCDEEYMPKPRGFFRITLPEKSYSHYVSPDCPFEFDIPVYASISKDSSRSAEPCFLNVDFIPFNSTLYLSYKAVHDDLPRLIEQHRNMAMKHIPKASGIEETNYSDPVNHIFGSQYYIKGSTASNVQFYLTDSAKKFIRASLYFNNAPQPDSIAPVLEFLDKDVTHLIETFRWK